MPSITSLVDETALFGSNGWGRIQVVPAIPAAGINAALRGASLLQRQAEDSVSPIIYNLVPAPGTPLRPGAAIDFDIIDNFSIQLCVLTAIVKPGAAAEVIHDGNNFSPPYRNSRRTAISKGYHFSLQRVGGWPSATVTLLPYVADNAGNLGKAEGATLDPKDVTIASQASQISLLQTQLASSVIQIVGLQQQVTQLQAVIAASSSGGTPVAPTAPATVSTILATGEMGAGLFRLDWVAPSDNGAAITGYNIILKNADTGATVSTIANTGNTAVTKSYSGLTNDQRLYAQIKAINSVGASNTAGISNTAEVNHIPLTLPVHGRWSNVIHPSNNTLRIRMSREAGGNGGAYGLSYNHIIEPSDGLASSLLQNLRTEDAAQEGDQIDLVFPCWFPTGNWPTSTATEDPIFDLFNLNGDRILSFTADHASVRLYNNGTQIATRTLTTNTRMVFRLSCLLSSDPAVGWVQLSVGNTAPGTTVLAKTFRKTMGGSLPLLFWECGLIHQAGGAVPSRRRFRHNNVTATITRNGVASRIRLDCDADTLRQRISTSAYGGTNGDCTYDLIETAGTQDRIALLMFNGELVTRFRVYAGDVHSNGQRAEISMVSRRSNSDSTGPQKQFKNGDKIVVKSKVWFPTDTSAYTLGGASSSSFQVEEQLHQLREDGGSPPHEFNPGTDQGQGYYGYRCNPGPTTLGGGVVYGTYTQIANPITRGQWYERELTVFVSDDPAVGYIILKENGVTLISKTYCRTNNLANGDTLASTGEVLGTDVPEQLSYSSGLYLRRGDQAGGFTTTNELMHGFTTIKLFRDPAAVPAAISV